MEGRGGMLQKNFVKGWNDSFSLEDTKNLAYFERNLLALLLAKRMNDIAKEFDQPLSCGYYIHGEWEGWARVISIDYGKITFHVPDDFDLGSLPLIDPNYDGHSTMEKWINVMKECGCKTEEEM
jgi:hypothetical protein